MGHRDEDDETPSAERYEEHSYEGSARQRRRRRRAAAVALVVVAAMVVPMIVATIEAIGR